MPSAIRSEHLRKVYGGGWRKRAVTAVDDLTLDVPEGEVFGFLGLNGAGKTTAVMMLLGAVHPTSGTGWLFGSPLGDPASRRRVGFLPEKFRFHEFLTARELLRFHGKLSGMKSQRLAERIDEVLETVGLSSAADRPIRGFSKGMQQRVGLAQALLPDPDLIILDEPTSALDPLGRRDVRSILLRLKKAGKTVFLNSHLLTEIELCCDRVAILHRGRLTRQGTVGELLNTGARVEVRAAGLTPAIREQLTDIGTVEPDGRPAGDVLHIRVANAADVPKIAQALVSGGASVHAIMPVRESLEDFFVRSVEGTP